ncbi:MAG: OmpA family protein [Chitinophagaceae bacterium]|nr:OmpA family protein [Chitinophagaceae bacterium]MBL0057267.1 OmpA family protein [Chitinophagaceae bacterium]
MFAGLGISYMQGLGQHVDFNGEISGSFLNYPVPGVASNYNTSLLLEATATANLKLFTDKYWFNPYLTAGIGGSKYRNYYGAFIPVGVGLQINVFDKAYVLMNSQYRMPVTDQVAYHFYHSIGIAAPLCKKKVVAPVVIPPPPVNYDRDNDGVPDSTDRCPDDKGLVNLKGCPDRDGDGIADIDDKCPDVPGLARYQGCPIPDTDKDGINDELDKCPTVPGLARYQGCPIPDTDKDGVNDEEDKCINEPGPASNFGCPIVPDEIIKKIEAAFKNVFFSTGSAKLLTKSYKPLNEVAKIMTDNPTYFANIDGHTDNTGKPDKNQILSENRAASVKTYLVSKGVGEDRLTATGYGQDKPIADNKTVKGRALNRRVEMSVRTYNR